MAGTAGGYMAETLRQAGDERIYGVVGDSLNGLTDALRRMDGAIEWCTSGMRKPRPSRPVPRLT